MSLTMTTKRRLVTAALLAPASLWLFVFLVLPFIAMVVFSVGERGPAGGYQAAFTFAQYANLPARSAAYWNTLLLAPVGSFLCLLVAYPTAYYLAVKASPRHRLLLVSLVVVPFWTSLLVRTYAWMYILGSRGLPNLLDMIGIADVRLLNTPGAVLLGIVYGYLPLMIMPIYVSLEKLDRRLLEASADLGATPFETFRRVTLPAIRSAIVGSALLCFTLSFDEIPVTYFLTGREVTLPIYIYSTLRRGITPEINAVGTVIVAASFILIILSVTLLRERRPT